MEEQNVLVMKGPFGTMVLEDFLWVAVLFQMFAVGHKWVLYHGCEACGENV